MMLHNGNTYNYNNSIQKKKRERKQKEERVSHPSIVLFIHPKGVYYQHTHFELLRVVCVWWWIKQTGGKSNPFI